MYQILGEITDCNQAKIDYLLFRSVPDWTNPGLGAHFR
jgi:hypothetical protein